MIQEAKTSSCTRYGSPRKTMQHSWQNLMLWIKYAKGQLRNPSISGSQHTWTLSDLLPLPKPARIFPSRSCRSVHPVSVHERPFQEITLSAIARSTVVSLIPVQHLSHLGGQLSLGEGFFNEVDAFIQGTTMGYNIGCITRHKQALQPGINRQDVFSQVPAVHLRHHHIGHEQVYYADMFSGKADGVAGSPAASTAYPARSSIIVVISIIAGSSSTSRIVS